MRAWVKYFKQKLKQFVTEISFSCHEEKSIKNIEFSFNFKTLDFL